MNRFRPRNVRRQALRLAILAGLTASGWSGISSAQDWTLQPSLRVGAEFEDNARLSFRTDDEVELEGLLLDAELGLAYTSERTSFDISPRLLLRDYSDEPEFDSEDLFLQAEYGYSGQKSEFGLSVRFDEQLVRNAELADADLDAEDPDDITDDTTGLVGLAGNRKRLRVRPSWSYDFTNTLSTGLSVDHLDISYDDVFAGQLSDFTDTRLNLDLNRGFSEKATGVIAATARQFDNDETDGEISGAGAMLGVIYRWSSTTTIRALVGAETADPENASSVTEAIANVSLRRQLQTIRLLAQYRRVINATGSGRLSVRDRISLHATRDLSERVSASIGLRASQDESLSPGVTFEGREFVQIRSRFQWWLTPVVSLEFDYRHTILDRGTLQAESATGNQVGIWVAYQPNNEAR